MPQNEEHPIRSLKDYDITFLYIIYFTANVEVVVNATDRLTLARKLYNTRGDRRGRRGRAYGHSSFR